MNKPWTDKIRQRMGHYEPQAPEGLYDDIMGAMARRGMLPQGQSQHRARRLPLWVNRVAVSAIAAAAVLTGVMLWTARTDVAPSVAQGGAVPASVARSVSECAEPASAVPPSAPARLVSQIAHLLSSAHPSAPTERSLAVLTDKLADSQAPLVSEPDAECSSTQAPATPPVTPQKSAPAHHGSRSLYGDMTGSQWADAKGHRSGRVGIDAYVQGVSSNQMSGNGSQAVSGFLAQDAPTYGALELLAPNGKNLLAATGNEVHRHHRQPIKAGVSLRYHIGDRWSVQTGVNYSYHSSDIEEENLTTEQRLHFVGIPVAASYSVWRNDHFNVYLTAGGEVEKLVRGTQRHLYRTHEQTDRVHMGQLQVSATLTAGAEYHITPVVGVYVEPGGVYHFDNGSGLSTIYHDHQLDFSLNLGVRFNLGR